MGANLVITGRNVQKLTDAKEELERLYGIKYFRYRQTYLQAQTIKQLLTML